MRPKRSEKEEKEEGRERGKVGLHDRPAAQQVQA